MAPRPMQAELKFRDGQREKISIKVENSLTSLISGIKELNATVSQILSVLVEREKRPGNCAQGEGEEEEEEDNSDEEEKPEERQNLEAQPPPKRSKT